MQTVKLWLFACLVLLGLFTIIPLILAATPYILMGIGALVIARMLVRIENPKLGRGDSTPAE